MFRSSLNRVLDWAERALAPIDEEWGAGGDESTAGEYPSFAYPGRERAPAPALPHPHRRELRWERKRRPGSVPRAPAHCISPVHHKTGPRTRQDSAR